MKDIEQRDGASGNFFELYRPKDASSFPKYQQVRFAMSEAIRSGFWEEGERVPTEEELVGLTGFSLGTVQRAVRMLAEDGILLRRQGSGTFISETTSQISEPWHFQFLDDDGKTVLPAYPKIVARKWTNQQGPWSHFLHRDESKTLRVDRVINVNDEFSAFSRFFIAGSYAELIDAIPVDQLHSANFRIVLSEAFRLPVTRIAHNVSVIKAPRDLAMKFRPPTNEPLLRVEIAATAGEKVPLYFQELLCPLTNRKLSLPSVGKY